MRETRVGKPLVVLVLRLLHSSDQARFTHELEERGVVDSERDAGQTGHYVPPAIDVGRQSVVNCNTRIEVRSQDASKATSRMEGSDIQATDSDVSTIKLVIRDGVQLERSKCGGGINQRRKREPQGFESAADLCGLLHSERNHEPMQIAGILDLESIASQGVGRL